MVFLVATLLICSATTEKFEPSVAFVCDRGTMHMHKDGSWAVDSKTDCMEGKENILKYCKTSYPALEITNIVESSEVKHIKGWCPLGKSRCGTGDTFKVRPYRLVSYKKDLLKPILVLS